jgi:Flp pilus assembly protein TadB
VSPRELGVRFDLKRNRLIWLFAVVFVVIAAVFALIIIQLADVQALATSVASYFLSLWSLRRIMEGEIKVFPTVFDAMILGLSILLLVLLVFRVAVHRFQQPRPLEINHQREDGPVGADCPPHT